MESREDGLDSELISQLVIREMTPAQKSVLGVSILFLLVFCYMVARTLLTHVITLPGLPGGPYGKMFPNVAFAFLFFFLHERMEKHGIPVFSYARSGMVGGRMQHSYRFSVRSLLLFRYARVQIGCRTCDFRPELLLDVYVSNLLHFQSDCEW